jgi:hypothetical protein
MLRTIIKPIKDARMAETLGFWINFVAEVTHITGNMCGNEVWNSMKRDFTQWTE